MMAEDQVLLHWPARSLDLTPCGYVKDSVFLLPLPQEELRYTTPANERKFEEGIHQEIKNDIEILVECED
jgi:hypothetical protein